MKKIQDKVSLEEFFGVPEGSSDEPNAPDPVDGWHNNTGGELVEQLQKLLAKLDILHPVRIYSYKGHYVFF